MGAPAPDQRRIVDGIGQVDKAILGLGRVLGPADGDSTRLARRPADKAVYGFLGDEERYTTLRFRVECSLEDKSIDELKDAEDILWLVPVPIALAHTDFLASLRGLAHLVRMWRGNEQDRALARDLPRASRVNLAEEEVNEDGHEPLKGVIFPLAHGIQLGMGGRRARALGRRVSFGRHGDFRGGAVGMSFPEGRDGYSGRGRKRPVAREQQALDIAASVAQIMLLVSSGSNIVVGLAPGRESLRNDSEVMFKDTANKNNFKWTL